MNDYLSLFQSNLQRVRKAGSDGQYIALCPYHKDKNPSFSVNTIVGVWNCKACGKRGNAYQFAKDFNMDNPNQYISDSNGSNLTNWTPPKVDLDCDDLLKGYIDNIERNKDKIPPNDIDIDLFKQLGIGFNEYGDMVFSYWKDGKVVGFKYHKKGTKGYAKNQWYPAHKIGDFKHDKPLIICEGEKDVIPLISWGNQAISVTGGAGSIPKVNDNHDLNILKEFESIHICYDNDEAGIKGSDKLSQAIRDAYPSKELMVYQWDKELPKTWDIWDSFTQDKGKSFYQAQKNAKIIEKTNNIGGFKLITGYDASVMNVTPKRQIIQSLIPEHSQIILGGTTGANKSFMAMQMGMSLANDEKEFLGFKINAKGLNVLYVDTECGEQVFVSRYKMLTKLFKWNGDGRFNMMTGQGDNVYDKIEQAIKQIEPNILIIDCLYNTTDGVDISKNHNIQPITKRITELKNRYDITIIAIHHMNKGGHELGLSKDRVAGGGALQNWAEHMVLITRTNEQSKRLLKIDKSRHIDYPECYYEIQWDSEQKKLINAGVCSDYRKLLIGNDKKYKWERALDMMEDKFTSNEFISYIESIGKTSRTGYSWLKEMVSCNVIEKDDWGKYNKRLKVLGSE